MATDTLSGHPVIDWTEWEPAGEGDGMHYQPGYAQGFKKSIESNTS